jgi:hypothetical protein
VKGIEIVVRDRRPEITRLSDKSYAVTMRIGDRQEFDILTGTNEETMKKLAEDLQRDVDRVIKLNSIAS